MTSGKSSNERWIITNKTWLTPSNFKVSKKSAFKQWKKPINGYRLLMDLIESGQMKLADKDGILTPFEGALWLDAFKIKVTNGIVKKIN
jgi:hypothetical protein